MDSATIEGFCFDIEKYWEVISWTEVGDVMRPPLIIRKKNK
jgi:hypothetical protein